LFYTYSRMRDTPGLSNTGRSESITYTHASPVAYQSSRPPMAIRQHWFLFQTNIVPRRTSVRECSRSQRHATHMVFLGKAASQHVYFDLLHIFKCGVCRCHDCTFLVLRTSRPVKTLNSAAGLPARVHIPVPPSATSRLLYELLGRVRLGFLVVSPFRIACLFLHVESARPKL
jgi:hypothetical protein